MRAARFDPIGQMARAPHGRVLPRVCRRVEVGRERGRVGLPRVGRRLGPQRRDAFRTEALDPLFLRLDIEDPVADPVVVVVAPGRGARLEPEVVVLAVRVDGEITRVEPAGMRAQRRLHDGQHAVARNPDQMRPRPNVVDDPLDGHDHAPARRERTPNAFEDRRVQRDIAGAVGDRRVQQRDVGDERRKQADGAERSFDSGERAVGFH